MLSGQIAMRWRRYAPLVDLNTRTNGVSGGSLTLSQLKVASTGSVVPAQQKTRLVPALEGTQRLARSGKPRRVVSDDRAPAFSGMCAGWGGSILAWRALDFGVESILVRPPDLTVAGASK